MPAIIPFLLGFFQMIWARLWAFIVFALPWIVQKILVLLGVGIVTYVGFGVAISQIETYVFTNFNNLATDLLAIMLILHMDVGLKIMFAAMAMALTIKTVSGTRRLVAGQGASFTQP